MCIVVTLYLPYYINLNSTEILTESTLIYAITNIASYAKIYKLQFDKSHFTQTSATDGHLH